jgi:hypothetical protein
MKRIRIIICMLFSPNSVFSYNRFFPNTLSRLFQPRLARFLGLPLGGGTPTTLPPRRRADPLQGRHASAEGSGPHPRDPRLLFGGEFRRRAQELKL